MQGLETVVAVVRDYETAATAAVPAAFRADPTQVVVLPPPCEPLEPLPIWWRVCVPPIDVFNPADHACT